MLDAAVAHGIRQIEACGGGHIPTLHFDPVRLAARRGRLARFRASLEERGSRCAPSPATGTRCTPTRSAPALTTTTSSRPATWPASSACGFVSLLAGLPAGRSGRPHARTGSINSAFPGLGDDYRWQWEERVLPYWREAARIADDHGVVLCVEPHSADVVYNTPTFKRLRDEIGPAIAMNFDPSHLWWQGIDPDRGRRRGGRTTSAPVT